jgi:uncharacterized protein YodC (DUF2158 family)
MSTKPDTRQIPDDILQAAIDAACEETHTNHPRTCGQLVLVKEYFPSGWPNEKPARLALARGLLARLPPPADSQDSRPADQPLLQPEPEVFVNGAGNPVSPPVPAWQPAVGDTVRLKSGGPVMTLSTWIGDFVKCQWFDNGTLKAGRFDPECLTPAKEAQP